jgi:quercetin dioxygenase-like cupin family protein
MADGTADMVISKEGEHAMKQLIVLTMLILSYILVGSAQPAQESIPMPNSSAHAIIAKYDDMKWERMVPELKERSPEISILHVNPATNSTQLMIRVPQNIHVPKHWHTANETHTIVRGKFIIECDGKRSELDQGSFNYMPSKMAHELL